MAHHSTRRPARRNRFFAAFDGIGAPRPVSRDGGVASSLTPFIF